MASTNRAALINKFLKVSKRHFKPIETIKDRTLLEHLLYACCLEDSLHEVADTVFEDLSQQFYDWNEVRVTSIRELAVIMKPLNEPTEAAKRLKRVLQSVFETHYSFDLEALKKQNIGQTVKQIEKYNGSTRFSIAYVTQHALGGHSIPINWGLLEAMRVVGVVSDNEAKKGRVPGLERVVSKNKGIELGTLLHQVVELQRSPYGPTIRKLLLEIDPDCKGRLPKRANRKVEREAREAELANKARAAAEAKAEARRQADAAKKEAAAATAAAAAAEVAAKKKKAAKALAPRPKATSKKKPVKKNVAKKKVVTKKKVAKKKVAKKSTPKKKSAKKKKSATKKTTKRKPR